MERVLVIKKKTGVVIGCSKDIADKYAAAGVVEIIAVSSPCASYPLAVGDNGREVTKCSSLRATYV
jgi:hypothetical protein